MNFLLFFQSMKERLMGAITPKCRWMTIFTVYGALFYTIVGSDCELTLVWRFFLQNGMLTAIAVAALSLFGGIVGYRRLQTHVCKPMHQVVVLDTNDDTSSPLRIKVIRVRLVEEETTGSALNDRDGEEAIDGALEAVVPEGMMSFLKIPSKRAVSMGELLSDVVKIDNHGLLHIPTERDNVHHCLRQFFSMTIIAVAIGFALHYLMKGVPIWFASSAQIEQAVETGLTCKYLDDCECSISTVVSWAYCLAVMYPLFIMAWMGIYMRWLLARHRRGEQYRGAPTIEEEEDRSAELRRTGEAGAALV
jgi:hypothetical protein